MGVCGVGECAGLLVCECSSDEWKCLGVRECVGSLVCKCSSDGCKCVSVCECVCEWCVSACVCVGVLLRECGGDGGGCASICEYVGMIIFEWSSDMCGFVGVYKCVSVWVCILTQNGELPCVV